MLHAVYNLQVQCVGPDIDETIGKEFNSESRVYFYNKFHFTFQFNKYRSTNKYEMLVSVNETSVVQSTH